MPNRVNNFDAQLKQYTATNDFLTLPQEEQNKFWISVGEKRKELQALDEQEENANLINAKDSKTPNEPNYNLPSIYQDAQPTNTQDFTLGNAASSLLKSLGRGVVKTFSSTPTSLVGLTGSLTGQAIDLPLRAFEWGAKKLDSPNLAKGISTVNDYTGRALRGLGDSVIGKANNLDEWIDASLPKEQRNMQWHELVPFMGDTSAGQKTLAVMDSLPENLVPMAVTAVAGLLPKAGAALSGKIAGKMAQGNAGKISKGAKWLADKVAGLKPTTTAWIGASAAETSDIAKTQQQKYGETNPITAIGLGSTAGLMETAVPGAFAKTLGLKEGSSAAIRLALKNGKAALAKEMAKQALKSGLTEFSTEVVQTIIEQAATATANPELMNVFKNQGLSGVLKLAAKDFDLQEALLAGVLGAYSGGSFSTIGNSAQSMAYRSSPEYHLDSKISAPDLNSVEGEKQLTALSKNDQKTLKYNVNKINEDWNTLTDDQRARALQGVLQRSFSELLDPEADTIEKQEAHETLNNLQKRGYMTGDEIANRLRQYAELSKESMINFGIDPTEAVKGANQYLNIHNLPLISLENEEQQTEANAESETAPIETDNLTQADKQQQELANQLINQFNSIDNGLSNIYNNFMQQKVSVEDALAQINELCDQYEAQGINTGNLRSQWINQIADLYNFRQNQIANDLRNKNQSEIQSLKESADLESERLRLERENIAREREKREEIRRMKEAADQEMARLRAENEALRKSKGILDEQPTQTHPANNNISTNISSFNSQGNVINQQNAFSNNNANIQQPTIRTQPTAQSQLPDLPYAPFYSNQNRNNEPIQVKPVYSSSINPQQNRSVSSTTTNNNVNTVSNLSPNRRLNQHNEEIQRQNEEAERNRAYQEAVDALESWGTEQERQGKAPSESNVVYDTFSNEFAQNGGYEEEQRKIGELNAIDIAKEAQNSNNRQAGKPLPNNNGYIGKKTNIIADGGNMNMVRTTGNFAIVELDSLVTNTEMNEAQNRDRTRAASQFQIENMSRGLEPSLLIQADNPSAQNGSMIVGEDMVVESGNGRTEALRGAYNLGNTSYKQTLISRASDFGINPDDVAKMDKPVLVRIRNADDGISREEFVEAANTSQQASRSPVEIAKTDARFVRSLFDLIDPTTEITSQKNAYFVQEFLNKLPPNEKSSMLDRYGSLSPVGIARVNNALFAAGYNDLGILARLIEAPENVKTILNGMALAAPAMAELGAFQDNSSAFKSNLMDALREAIGVISSLRKQRLSPSSYFMQNSLGNDGLSLEARMMISVFANLTTQNDIKNFFKNYAESAKQYNPNQIDMFTGEPIKPPSTQSLIYNALSEADPSLAELVQQQAESVLSATDERFSLDNAKTEAERKEEVKKKVASLIQLVNEVKKNLNRYLGINIDFVDNLSDQHGNMAKAKVSGNKVTLNMRRMAALDPTETVKTLAHEIIGHIGVPKFLGRFYDGLKNSLDKARESGNIDIQEAFSIISKRYADQIKNNAQVLYDEVIAYLVENHYWNDESTNKLSVRLRGWTRDLLRALGFKSFLGNDLTVLNDADLARLFKHAKEEVTYAGNFSTPSRGILNYRSSTDYSQNKTPETEETHYSLSENEAADRDFQRMIDIYEGRGDNKSYDTYDEMRDSRLRRAPYNRDLFDERTVEDRQEEAESYFENDYENDLDFANPDEKYEDDNYLNPYDEGDYDETGEPIQYENGKDYDEAHKKLNAQWQNIFPIPADYIGWEDGQVYNDEYENRDSASVSPQTRAIYAIMSRYAGILDESLNDIHMDLESPTNKGGISTREVLQDIERAFRKTFANPEAILKPVRDAIRILDTGDTSIEIKEVPESEIDKLVLNRQPLSRKQLEEQRFRRDHYNKNGLYEHVSRSFQKSLRKKLAKGQRTMTLDEIEALKNRFKEYYHYLEPNGSAIGRADQIHGREDMYIQRFLDNIFDKIDNVAAKKRTDGIPAKLKAAINQAMIDGDFELAEQLMSEAKKYKKTQPQVKVQDLLNAIEFSKGDKAFGANDKEARENFNQRVKENKERFKPLYSLDDENTKDNSGELSNEEWDNYVNEVIQTNENAKNGMYANEDLDNTENTKEGIDIDIDNPYREEESSIRYSLVTDKDLLNELESGRKIKQLRSMQVIDLDVYPPMSAYNGENGELVPPTEFNQWYQSDERPEQITHFTKDGYGKITLRKKRTRGKEGALKTLGSIDYAPYWHTSSSPLNDQFSEAYSRPELVTVECEIPESELTSGYRAKHARKTVGETDWHNGPVSSQLGKIGKPRRVALSRWCKITRIIPDTEVAQMIAKQLRGTNIGIPLNTVTPNMFKELYKLGVKFYIPSNIHWKDFIAYKNKLIDEGYDFHPELEPPPSKKSKKPKNKSNNEDSNTRYSLDNYETELAEINLNGEVYTAKEIEDMIKADFEDEFSAENGYDNIEVVDVKVIGSRAKGNYNSDSDLDVLLEYRGNLREDDAFNSMADRQIELNGVKVDINPITADKSGTIQEWLERNYHYDKNDGGDNDRYSLDEKPYYQVPFEESVDKIINGNFTGIDNVFVTNTPKVLNDIGFINLPLLMTKQHVLSIYNSPSNTTIGGNKHDLGNMIKQLPNLIHNPLMVITSKTHPSTSVVLITSMKDNNNNDVIVPIKVDGSGRADGLIIDTHFIASAYGKKNAYTKLVADAINDESNGNIGIFYASKNIKPILRTLGLQLPNGTRIGSINHKINDFGSPVKGNFKSQTETKQFKRWFGDSIMTENGKAGGKPKIFYHGTDKYGFSVFNDGSYFTDNPDYAKRYETQRFGKNSGTYAVYLNIKNPFDIRKTEDRKIFTEFRNGHEPSNTKTGAMDWAEFDYDDLTEYLKENYPNKYDGYVIDEGGDTSEKHRGLSYVVFEPNQIKSATDNIGTFDENNPDVRYSLSPEERAEMNEYYKNAIIEIDNNNGEDNDYKDVEDIMNAIKNAWLNEEEMRLAARSKNYGIKDIALKSTMLPTDLIEEFAKSENVDDRRAVALNPSLWTINSELQDKLALDQDRLVRRSVLINKSSEISENVLKELAKDPDLTRLITNRQNVPDSVLDSMLLNPEITDIAKEVIAEKIKNPNTINKLLLNGNINIFNSVTMNENLTANNLRTFIDKYCAGETPEDSRNYRISRILCNPNTDSDDVVRALNNIKGKLCESNVIPVFLNHQNPKVAKALVNLYKNEHLDPYDYSNPYRDFAEMIRQCRITEALNEFANLNSESLLYRIIENNHSDAKTIAKVISNPAIKDVSHDYAYQINSKHFSDDEANKTIAEAIVNLEKESSLKKHLIKRIDNGKILNNIYDEYIAKNKKDENLPIWLCKNPSTPENILAKFSKDKSTAIRALVANNQNTSEQTLRDMMFDENEEDIVIARAIRNATDIENLHNVTDDELMPLIKKYGEYSSVPLALADCLKSEEALTKLYDIYKNTGAKFNIVNNFYCPEAILLQEAGNYPDYDFEGHKNFTESVAAQILKSLQKNPEANARQLAKLMRTGKVKVASIKDSTMQGVNRWRRELGKLLSAAKSLPEEKRKLSNVVKTANMDKNTAVSILSNVLGSDTAKQWNSKNIFNEDILQDAADYHEYHIIGPLKRGGVQALGDEDAAISMFHDTLDGKYSEAAEKLGKVQVASGHPAGFGFVLESEFTDKDRKKAAIITEVQSDIMSVLFDDGKSYYAKELFGDQLDEVRKIAEPLKKTWVKSLLRNAMRRLYDIGVERIYAITPNSLYYVLGANPPAYVVNDWAGEKAAKREGFGKKVTLKVNGQEVEAWDGIEANSIDGNEIRYSLDSDTDDVAPFWTANTLAEAEELARNPQDTPYEVSEKQAKDVHTFIKTMAKSLIGETRSEASLEKDYFKYAQTRNPDTETDFEIERRNKIDAGVKQREEADSIIIDHLLADKNAIMEWIKDRYDEDDPFGAWLMKKTARVLAPYQASKPIERIAFLVAEHMRWNPDQNKMVPIPGIRVYDKDKGIFVYKLDDDTKRRIKAAESFFNEMTPEWKKLIETRAKASEEYRRYFVETVVPQKIAEASIALLARWKQSKADDSAIEKVSKDIENSLAQIEGKADQRTVNKLRALYLQAKSIDQERSEKQASRIENLVRAADGKLKSSAKLMAEIDALKSNRGIYGYVHHAYTNDRAFMQNKAYEIGDDKAAEWAKVTPGSQKLRSGGELGEGGIDNLMEADIEKTNKETRADAKNGWLRDMEEQRGLPESEVIQKDPITGENKIVLPSGYDEACKIIAKFGDRAGETLYLPKEVFDTYRLVTQRGIDDPSLKEISNSLQFLDDVNKRINNALLYHPAKFMRDIYGGIIHLVEFWRDTLVNDPKNVLHVIGLTFEGIKEAFTAENWQKHTPESFGEFSEAQKFTDTTTKSFLTNILDAAGHWFTNTPIGSTLAALLEEVNLSGSADLPLKRIMQYVGEQLADEKGLTGNARKRFIYETIDTYAFDTKNLPELISYARGQGKSLKSKALGSAMSAIVPFMGYSTRMFKQMLADPVNKGLAAFIERMRGNPRENSTWKKEILGELGRPFMWILLYSLFKSLPPDDDESPAEELQYSQNAEPTSKVTARKLVNRDENPEGGETWLSTKGFGQLATAGVLRDVALGKASLGDFSEEFVTIHPLATQILDWLGKGNSYDKVTPTDAKIGRALAMFCVPQMSRFGQDFAKLWRLSNGKVKMSDSRKQDFFSAFLEQLGLDPKWIGKDVIKLDADGEIRTTEAWMEALKWAGLNMRYIPHKTLKDAAEKDLGALQKPLQSLSKIRAYKQKDFSSDQMKKFEGYNEKKFLSRCFGIMRYDKVDEYAAELKRKIKDILKSSRHSVKKLKNIGINFETRIGEQKKKDIKSNKSKRLTPKQIRHIRQKDLTGDPYKDEAINIFNDYVFGTDNEKNSSEDELDKLVDEYLARY